MNIDKSKGYIPVWRHLASSDWEWTRDPHTTFLYIWLAAKANFVTKVWKGRTVLAGQYITSLNRLSEETGLSKQEVRTALKHLISTQYITHEASKNFSVITINNYDELYTLNTSSSTTATHGQHSANTALTPTKTYNNENNANNENKVDKAGKPRRAPFEPPTLEEVKAYFIGQDSNALEGEKFFDYYTSCAWVVGKNKKMADWRAAARRWIKNAVTYRQQKQPENVVDKWASI